MTAPDSPLAPLAPVSFGDTPAPVAPPAPDAPVSFGGVLDEVRDWFARFVCTIQDSDLDLLTLWAAHTHLAVETYTTPRLILDSPVPGSGKTTVLEHLGKLCFAPVQMASLSSPAMLARLLDAGMRTLLIDEADRSLSPNKDGIEDLIAVLNSGYKRGGTRPTLIPHKEEGWITRELPTFAPVAMAGNSPNLPEDTRSRAVRVLLMPDVEDSVDESDWEYIDAEATALGERLALWADHVRDQVREARPSLPPEVRGRAKERWRPLKRVAVVVGGRWPDVVDELASHDIEEQELAKEEGLMLERPHVALMKHLAAIWGDGETFLPTETILARLIFDYPETWGAESSFGKPLTAQRLGRMLSGNYRISSTRLDRTGPRGYTFAALAKAFRTFAPTPSNKPAQPAQVAQPAQCQRCGDVLDGAAIATGSTICTGCELASLTI